MNKPLYQIIASKFQARLNCLESGNDRWAPLHLASIERLVREHLPSGSGFDSGSKFNHVDSRPECLLFDTSFHHMNQDGFYDGWTHHQVRVFPSLAHGFRLTISGKNKNEIKEYIDEMFSEALRRELEGV